VAGHKRKDEVTTEGATRRRLIVKSIVCTFAILLVWAILAPHLAEGLIVTRPLRRAEAILVLAGSSAYLERTRTAAHVYKMSAAPKILLTSDGERASASQERQRNRPFVELAKEELIAHGVPYEAIEIMAPQVSGTIMEADLLGKHVAERRWKSLLIVTSAYHTRRALWSFQKAFARNGADAEIGIVSPSPGQQTPTPLFWWVTWKGWRDVAGEYVKSIFYWLCY
jgi:uncharacterized SAM-binding protein YcdF (DUF218 family)